MRAWRSRCLLATALLFPCAAHAGETTVLPLVFHVVTSEGQEVVPAGFVAERVARANEIFEQYGVRFVAQEPRPLDTKHAALETRADRDALGAYAERGAIDCFVVRSLRDVDDPTQMRRGVHWHSQTHAGTHFVIISSISGPNVLAHELGHYLGNPAHSDVPGNLMSYTPAEGLPFLDDKQRKRLRRTIQGYLRSSELRAHAR